MSDKEKLPARSNRAEVDQFLQKVAAAPKPSTGQGGRLIFALDATASREPSWDRACHIQAEMFDEAKSLGGLAIQLAFYRGYGEFEATPWSATPEDLLRRMTEVRCRSGRTQIARILRHALDETKKRKVQALIFIGDSVEESAEELAGLAGQLRLAGLPAFIFHEGRDPVAARVFGDIARLSGGACCRFDSASPQQLRDLLRAVAAFAAGGRKALEAYGQRKGGAAKLLTDQMGTRR